MSQSLELILDCTGKFKWQPPETISNAVTQKPINKDLNSLKNELGFRVKLLAIPNIVLVKTAWIDKLSTYFAELSAGSLCHYQIKDTTNMFTIEQRRVEVIHSPYMFVYPPTINAYQKNINGFNSIVVIPPEEPFLIPFAKLIIGEMLFDITFYWRAEEHDIDLIIASIV
jgi:hypothetical protein